MDANNQYTKWSQGNFESNSSTMAKVGGPGGHSDHNSNPDYWDIILGPVQEDPEYWDGRLALDFGCGHGRNIWNMMELAPFARVDGVDISQNNVNAARAFINNKSPRCLTKIHKNNGIDIECLNDEDTYDFVMSTIVFEHICVRSIRLNLMKSIYDHMATGGIFSLQMLYSGKNTVPYDNEDMSTTALHCSVDNKSVLVDDLTKIGFSILETWIKPSFSSVGKEWIFLHCLKDGK